jgi:uncharacterized membrane protein YeaQ/YmgE (transglycosylase-associated protein family)
MMGLFAVWILSGFVGWCAGYLKGNTTAGLFLGLLLGPIGWLIVMVLPDRQLRCGQCCGVVSNEASRCRHCGERLPHGPRFRSRRKSRSSDQDAWLDACR